MTTKPARDELRRHLIGTRIAGDVATGRESNLANIGKCLRREPDYTFGLTLGRDYTPDDLLAIMAERVGISPDPDYVEGPDTIDPDKCIAALDKVREEINHVVARRGRVLLASGHPTGLLAPYQKIAAALTKSGCTLVAAADGDPITIDNHTGRVVYVGDVAVLGTPGMLLHTHRAEPMRVVLDALDEKPDLVIADHGWAGTAAEAGLRTVGFADCNDPALFVAESEGRMPAVVPLDDNVLPRCYDPIAAYLTIDLFG